MKLLVFSKNNVFSNNILSLMCSLGYLKLEKTNTNNPKEVYSVFLSNTLAQNIKAIEVDDYLYLNDDDLKNFEKEFGNDLELIIISTHKSESQKIDTISIHVCGNFNKNELGGEINDFSVANLDAFEFLYNSISNDLNKPKELNFFVEATHHGPTLNTKLIYYEIGPNDDSYNNKDYQKYYLNKLIDYLKFNYKAKEIPYILIGAPHYLDKTLIDSIKSKLKQKYNLDNIILSHIMPKYSLNELLENDDDKIQEIFEKLIKKSLTNKVIINKEYMKSLTRIINILEKIKCEKFVI